MVSQQMFSIDKQETSLPLRPLSHINLYHSHIWFQKKKYIAINVK